MLPPFVPPMARVSSESLPLITEFVVDHSERSFEVPSPATVADSWTTEDVGTLPSIQDYVLERRESSPEGPGQAALTQAHPQADMPADQFADETVHAAMIPEPIVNEVAEPEDAWSNVATAMQPEGLETLHVATATEDSGGLSAEPQAELQAELEEAAVSEHAVEQETTRASDTSEVPETQQAPEAHRMASEPFAPGTTATSQPEAAAAHDPSSDTSGSPAEWVTAERDSFDWKGVAGLAVPPDEARRAAEDWSSTEWDRTKNSAHDHVAGLLSQVARRVRSGELQVQSSHHMTAEAALAAVLAALLVEPGTDR